VGFAPTYLVVSHIEMNNMKTILLILLAASSIWAQEIHPGDLYGTVEQRKYLMDRAVIDGDHNAAFLLGQYYQLERHDLVTGDKWFMIAGILGNPGGAFNYASKLESEISNKESIDECRLWYQKAVKLGHEYSVKILEQFNKKHQ